VKTEWFDKKILRKIFYDGENIGEHFSPATLQCHQAKHGVLMRLVPHTFCSQHGLQRKNNKIKAKNVHTE